MTKPRARENNSPAPVARAAEAEVSVFQTARLTSMYAKSRRSATISAARELRQSRLGVCLYGVMARQTKAVGIMQRKKSGIITAGAGVSGGSACIFAAGARVGEEGRVWQ